MHNSVICLTLLIIQLEIKSANFGFMNLNVVNIFIADKNVPELCLNAIKSKIHKITNKMLSNCV